MKQLIIFLIIGTTCLPQLLAQDTKRMDISDQLFYYDKDGKQVQYNNEGSQNNIHFKNTNEDFVDYRIQILAPKNTSLLVHNKILEIISEDGTVLDLNNEINSGEVTKECIKIRFRFSIHKDFKMRNFSFCIRVMNKVRISNCL